MTRQKSLPSISDNDEDDLAFFCGGIYDYSDEEAANLPAASINENAKRKNAAATASGANIMAGRNSKRRKMTLVMADSDAESDVELMKSKSIGIEAVTPLSSDGAISDVKQNLIDLDSDELTVDVKCKDKEITLPNTQTPTRLARWSTSRSFNVINPPDVNHIELHPNRAFWSAEKSASSSVEYPTIVASAPAQEKTTSEVTTLSDDSDGDVHVTCATKTELGPFKAETDNPVDADPLFESYIRIARARREAAAAVARTGSVEGEGQDGTGRQSMSAGPPANDVEIKMMLGSRLPGTVPKVFKRKLHQNMIMPLEVWVRKHRDMKFDIDRELESKLILTFRGNKIYKTTTAAQLGAEVGPDGQIKRPQGLSGDNPGDGYCRDGLFLEVWTEELYAEYLAEKEREQRGELGEFRDEDLAHLIKNGPAENGQGAQEGLESRRGIRMVLKAKNYELIRCSVKPDSTVAKLVEVFRHKHGVGPERSVTIVFDGEKLMEGMEVQEMDIDEDEVNQVEVHIK